MKTSFKQKLTLGLASLLMLCGACLPVGFVHAEGETTDEKPAVEIQVAPTMVVVTMQGGDVLEGNSQYCTTGTEYGCQVQVKNTGRETFEFKVYVTPYSISSEDNEVNFSADSSSTYTQIARWLTLADANGNYAKEVRYTINPDEVVTIPFRVTVPEDVPGGMQRAAIWAEAITGGNGASSNMGISANARAAVVVAGRSIGDSHQAADISEYHFDRFSLGGPLSAKATVKNTGNTDFVINATYTARTFLGKVIKEEKETIPAYPDVEYHLSTEWENTPYLGIFTVNYKVVTPESSRDETHVAVIMPIPIIILVISLLTIIIVWIIIIIRKRKERKARMLV